MQPRANAMIAHELKSHAVRLATGGLRPCPRRPLSREQVSGSRHRPGEAKITSGIATPEGQPVESPTGIGSQKTRADAEDELEVSRLRATHHHDRERRYRPHSTTRARWPRHRRELPRFVQEVQWSSRKATPFRNPRSAGLRQMGLTGNLQGDRHRPPACQSVRQAAEGSVGKGLGLNPSTMNEVTRTTQHARMRRCRQRSPLYLHHAITKSSKNSDAGSTPLTHK